MSQQISWLTPRDAQERRSQLIQALGSENRPGQWMSFMETAYRLMPEVLSSGRPSIEAIQSSLIGHLGFSGWREMIEAPISDGGLGWNWSAWAQWKRAWTWVKRYPYLLDEGLTAAQINRIVQQAKDAGQNFPANHQVLIEFESQRQATQKDRRAESVEGLKKRVYELEVQVRERDAACVKIEFEASTLREQMAGLVGRLDASAQTVGRLESDLKQAQKDAAVAQSRIDQERKRRAQLEQQNQKAREQVERLRAMSKWQHFKVSIGLK